MRNTWLVGALAAVAGCASTQSAPPSAPAAAPAASGAGPTAAAPAPGAPAQAGAAPKKTTVPGKRTAFAIGGAKWYVYDGVLLPSESPAAFTEGGGSGGTAAGFSTANGNGTISFDSQDPANKASWVFAPAVEGSPPKSFTFVARMKADDQSDRGFDIEFRFGDKKAGKQGPRAKFILKPNEVQIEKPDGESASTQKFRLDATDYHTYQLAFDINGDQVVTNVYIDGKDTPIMTTQGNQLVNDNRFSFGDSGSNTCKGTIDWMIWTDTAALKPSALKGKLPPPIGDVSSY